MSPKQRAAMEELARRRLRRDAMLAGLHAKQRAVIESLLHGSQYVSVLCGRRAGKTEMDARVIAIALEMCGTNEWVIYAALTRKLAKDLIWARLVDLNEKHGFGWRTLHHEAAIETTRGGRFRVLGFDATTELSKTRGYKLRCAIFDEPATYSDKLDELIRECVGPALGDLRGWLLINGTPGAVCAGFWHDVSTGKRQRYTNFSWTVLDNTAFPRDPREMLAEERAENGWGEDDPTYRREWMGEWFSDPSAQVYKYVEHINLAGELPANYAERGGGWTFSLGVDFGYSPDPCAWVVLGSPHDSRDIYVVHDEQHHELLPDEAAEVTAKLVERFDPAAVVGDPAAAAYIAEWNRRWSEKSRAWMLPADKLGKVDAIEVFNGDLRSGRLKVYKHGAKTWRAEASALPWKNERRQEEHPRYPNHSCDAGLYAHRKHRSYLHEVPQPPPPPDQAALLAQQQRIDRAQAALRAQAQEEDDW